MLQGVAAGEGIDLPGIVVNNSPLAGVTNDGIQTALANLLISLSVCEKLTPALVVVVVVVVVRRHQHCGLEQTITKANLHR